MGSLRKVFAARTLASRLRLAANVVVSLILITLVLPAAAPALDSTPANKGFALSNGQFFTQTGDRPGTGFEVRDEGRDEAGHVIRFWSEFNRLGGVDVLGYPISREYRSEGFHYQVFQRALLQWRPEANATVFANILDQLSASGADAWLASKGIPDPIVDDGSRGDFAAAVQMRLSWLTEPHVKDYYLGLSPDRDPRRAMERYGLPSSPPLRFGPFIVQRFQRGALQVWLDQVPGMPSPGTVVPVLVGDLYREHTTAKASVADLRFVPQFSSSTLTPTSPSAGVSMIADGLKLPLSLLAENPAGRITAEALIAPGVRVVFERVPAIAIFSANRMTVAVNPDYATADPKALAAVLAHEGSHLTDYLAGVEMHSPAGCYRTEFVAFETQARVWRGFYGASGKPDATEMLDVELNRILDGINTSPEAFNTSVKNAYRDECGAG